MNDDTHKQQVASVFDLVANDYNNPATQFFPFTAHRIVDYLKPKPGNSMLDIACGTGVVCTTLAPLILPEGRVQAIDLSEKMLQETEKQLERHGLKNVDLHVMDAEKLNFKHDTFDAIACSFGLFFIPDMDTALRDWLRVLKPQGQLMFTSFEAQSFKPLAELFVQRIQGYGVEVNKTLWQRLDSATACEKILSDNGYQKIATHTEQLGYHLSSEQDWWELCWSTGYRGLLEQLSGPQLSDFRQLHLEEVAALKTDQGIWLDINVIFSSAFKPD